MIKENLTAFLQEQMAHRTRHSGRTLYDHLIGTHDLLEKWGADEDVRHAGLYHSIYGTRRFRHQSWPLSDRKTIKTLLGDPCEFLVYLFCVTDRPRALFRDGYHVHLLDDGACYVKDMYSNSDVLLRADVIDQLLTIEAANLLEQDGAPHWLARLLDENICGAAKDDIRQHLKRRLGAWSAKPDDAHEQL